MKFILTALCCVSLSAAGLRAADVVPTPFPPNAAHTNVTPYSVEAAIPLKDLGFAPAPGQVLKMDWGVLTTDDGFVTRSRAYWANPMATGVADEPTEARLQPELWGHVCFAASADERGMPGLLEPSSQPSSVDDLLD